MGKVGPETVVRYATGCDVLSTEQGGFGTVKWEAPGFDVVVAVTGLTPELEGEMGDAAWSDGGDRRDLAMPGVQEELLKLVKSLNKPLVVVMTGGSAVAINWAQEHADAIVWAWYPGEEGGNAVGDVLFGDANPAGRLPVTFYKSIQDVPPFDDYSMRGRTYRYFAGEPLYPFGFGLSYTRFAYERVRLAADRLKPGQALAFEVALRNTGTRDGDEVVQLYLTPPAAGAEASVRCQLCGFERVHLQAGEARTLTFTVTPNQLEVVQSDGKPKAVPGRFRLTVGGCSPGPRGVALGAAKPVTAEFTVGG